MTGISFLFAWTLKWLKTYHVNLVRKHTKRILGIIACLIRQYRIDVSNIFFVLSLGFVCIRTFIVITHGKKHRDINIRSDIQHICFQSIMLCQSNIIYNIATLFEMPSYIKLLQEQTEFSNTNMFYENFLLCKFLTIKRRQTCSMIFSLTAIQDTIV